MTVTTTVVVGGCHKSAENAAPRTTVAKAGSAKLFNGKDLTGWQTEGNARWVVENELLIGTQGANNAPGDLFTRESFGDFKATIIYRTEWPCNRGV